MIVEEDNAPSRHEVQLTCVERNEEVETDMDTVKKMLTVLSALPNIEAYAVFFFRNNPTLLHLSRAICRLPTTVP